MGSKEFRCPPYFSTTLTGLAIREYLDYVKVGYPYEFYVCFKKYKPSTSYQSVVRYFWILKKLGLIRETGTEKGNAPIPRKLYEIAIYDDPRWYAPQVAMYPETRLGSKRYKWYKRTTEIEKETKTTTMAQYIDEVLYYFPISMIPDDAKSLIDDIINELRSKGEAYTSIAKAVEYIRSNKKYDTSRYIYDFLETLDNIAGTRYTEFYNELINAPSIDYIHKHLREIINRYR